MNLPQYNLITEPPLLDQNTLISDSPTLPGIHVDQPITLIMHTAKPQSLSIRVQMIKLRHSIQELDYSGWFV